MKKLVKFKFNLNWKIIKQIFYILAFFAPTISKFTHSKEISLLITLIEGMINTAIWYILIEGTIWIFKKIRLKNNIHETKKNIK